ncbi:LexA family protein [Chitinimonas sp. BJB300]|uniref:LexA family protein n=1 Tax=Chitinimonas sp. BJB300 TaxID=1559339 RepID=UPI000C0F9FA5|nr:translesion error-prone DNA polymerase V autoproteolytic subunit [Chitinimonas sp. BJB300]PHV10528.1 hypothetical protein CSQ89_15700 [Chitinimonas sp. BJB300]TSJ85222.1 translesion error-prone DNA polymerase V autoproteolytic subunit [Chitinimonas sp. BJB300]
MPSRPTTLLTLAQSNTAYLLADRFWVTPYEEPSTTPLRIPIGTEAVPAGFPSPAADHMDEKLSLDELLVHHPAATYMLRVKGDSMRDDHICDGDVLVVDRSIKPASGHIVIAVLDGEFTVKRLRLQSNSAYLVPANPEFPTIEVKEGQELQIWGVVTSTIHRFQRA